MGLLFSIKSCTVLLFSIVHMIPLISNTILPSTMLTVWYCISRAVLQLSMQSCVVVVSMQRWAAFEHTAVREDPCALSTAALLRSQTRCSWLEFPDSAVHLFPLTERLPLTLSHSSCLSLSDFGICLFPRTQPSLSFCLSLSPPVSLLRAQLS